MIPPNIFNLVDAVPSCELSHLWKRLHGAKLDGAEHFQKNCQNVPGAAGAAVGAAAGAAAASAVCIYYVTRCTFLEAACKTLAGKF